MLLALEDIARSYGDRCLFRDVALVVNAGDRIGLVGPNGAGKTSLMRIAAGLDAPDAGRRQVRRGARVAMLRQEIDPTLERSVREEAGLALAHLDALETELRELEARMTAHAAEVPAELATRYDRVHHSFEQGGGFGRASRVDRVLSGLGFENEDRDRPLRSFSGGWLMRVELAKLLLAEPDVLLLDEPTNHLDLPSIQWFEETLSEFRGGVVVISHDRTFLRRHVGRVAELSGGRFTVYEGAYDRYLEQRTQRREEALARKRSQDRQIAETERFIERFRAKASKARQVQSRVKALERLERVEVEAENRRRLRLRIPPAARAGSVVLRLEDIHKAYEETRVYNGIDLEIRRGDRVALVGPNGAGKSTLLRILAGALPPDAGRRELGHNVTASFFAQHQLEALDPANTVLSELEGQAKHDDYPRLRGQLGAFLFSGDDVDKRVSVLSGGEKARLALAKLLLRPANLLVLDEPTNHLDVEACEVLEEALRGYDGTLVFISHDRSFINALATRVIEVRAGRLREFLGNYDHYLASLEGAATAGPGAVTGHGNAAAATPATAPPPGPEERPRSREERQRSRERRKARERTARKLERLEAAILEKETELEQLGWKLGDPEVFRDGDQVRVLEAERGALRDTIAGLYTDWERLAAELEVLTDDDEQPSPAALTAPTPQPKVPRTPGWRNWQTR